jgi:hypothetical protein
VDDQSTSSKALECLFIPYMLHEPAQLCHAIGFNKIKEDTNKLLKGIQDFQKSAKL